MKTERVAAVLCGLVLMAGCSGKSGSPKAAPPPSTQATTTTEAPNLFPGYKSDIYADKAHWLCRPDMRDVCDDSLDATAVRADGTLEVQKWQPAANPPIDCFYVYPTISTDPTPNSDLVPGEDQELFVVKQQAARLGSQCRVFAPVYRSGTLTALTARMSGNTSAPGAEPGLAYRDVVDAWKYYMANDNQGRGMVLIGHSQGSGLLTQLVKNEIDKNPGARERLVSALLLGSGVTVPEGADVGADFANVSLCKTANQTGCVVNYSSFRAASPPPANSLFGRKRSTGRAACTNPAALGGGVGTLHPYFSTNGRSLPGTATPAQIPWTSTGVPITTPFVTLPDFVTAECVQNADFNYLAITVLGNPADPRIDNIGGDLTPEWGLHLIDVGVAMGDLVDLVGKQADAFTHR